MAEPSVLRQLAFYLVVQLVSVVAPGVVLVCEVAYLLVALTGPVDRQVVETAEQAASAQGIPLLVLAALLLAGAVLVGYLAREIAFALLRMVEARRRPAGVAQLRDQLVAMFGAAHVAAVVRQHPGLRPLAAPAATGATDEGARTLHLQGWGRDPGATRVFFYCKLWLRSRAPALSVDQIELEINSLLAMLLPAVFLPVTLLVSLSGPVRLAAGLVGFTLVGLVWVFVLWRASQLRRAERWEAVRNMFFGGLMESAATEASVEHPAPAPRTASDDQPAPRPPAADAGR